MTSLGITHKGWTALLAFAAAMSCQSEAPPVAIGAAAAAETSSTAAAVVPTSVDPVAPPVEPEPAKPAQIYLAVTIERSLEATFVAATEQRLGAQLAQVTKRVLVWWLDVRRDLRAGDKLEIIYETREDQEPLVHAIWIASEKLGGARSAVRYQPAGARFARWYDASGREVERRLKNAPLAEYEQITSLLSDGRGHRGVDFKAPVGEPVVAPFDGKVVRRNWSSRRNGNCLHLIDRKGQTTAYFLHLSNVKKTMRPGTKVKAGQIIGWSGNTGRSSAPHLHYQLERNERVIDPFRFHDTWQKELPDEERQRVRERLARLDELRTRST